MLRRCFWFAAIVAAAFLGGLASRDMLSLSGLPVAAQQQPPGQSREHPYPLVTDLVAISDRFELVARRVAPSVVYVEARKDVATRSGGQQSLEESGSGVIVRLEGRRETLVFTNNHVVQKAPPERILVHLADGRIFRPSRVWTDPESDVAVLALDAAADLPAAPLGDSSKMLVGHWVLAIGSPFGLNQTVTHGIISARGRGQVSLGGTIRIKDFLQTDAAINPGSSGGPLVNLNGEVIGINTAIASPNGSSSGVAFSIPSNMFKKIALQLLEKGAVARGYLGVQLARSFEPADALKRGLAKAHGALVEIVYPNTPAQQAGLREGDVILEWAGVEILNENHLINLISDSTPGDAVKLVVWRERRRLPLEARVGDWNKAQPRQP